MLLLLSALLLLPGSAVLCKHKRLPLIIFCLSNLTHPLTDLEATKKTIITTLQQEQPHYLQEFTTFFKKYDDLVHAFFDKENNASLKSHIEHMETELHILKEVCTDTKYQCIHSILQEYPHQMADLIRVLKSYIGSKNAVKLAFEVHKFKPILPEKVKKQGDVSLLFALRHRLACG